MTTSARSHGTVDPARALDQVVRPRVPARASGRAVALRVAQEAIPVVARSVAAGMAVLAIDQAVRRFVDGAAMRALPSRRVALPPPAPRPYTVTLSLTETIIIERVRRRR